MIPEPSPVSIENNELRRVTLLIVIFVALLGYPLVVAISGSKTAIEAGNVIVLSLASGIVVAYAPIAWEAIKQYMVDGAGILSIGIFASWLGVAYARAGSIIWRLFDKPMEWLDSAFWGAHIMFTMIGALCHLVAPEAISGRVPTKQWIKIGVLVAVGVFMAATLTILNSD